METRFATWKEAHTAAVLFARERGRDVGLESLPSPLERGRPWRIFGLPLPQNRQGFELRCEVVSPSDPI